MNRLMRPLPNQEEAPQGERAPLASRRRFLGGLVTGGLGVIGLPVAVAVPLPPSPREIPLQEADFYAPHTLAG